jgi:type 1 fimbriae regulatory protein FimB/type 1 fimbriae regulatory protein FimE
LTGEEVERLIAAAGNNRHGHRHSTMVLIAYRHGLRPAEVVALRWDQVDFATARSMWRGSKAAPPPQCIH